MSILVSFFDNCLNQYIDSRMKLQTTAHCFRVVSLRPYYYRSRHSTRNVPKKFVTYRTRTRYINTYTNTHNAQHTCTHIYTHTQRVYTRRCTACIGTYTRDSRTRDQTRITLCREKRSLKIKWKCIPDERNIVLSKGHVLYVCVVHSLNKNYI